MGSGKQHCPRRMRTTPKRYAAKLLFQFRVESEGKRRLCEERIILVPARSGKAALTKAKRHAKASEFSYKNSDARRVHFEFIGVMDLLHLGPECEPGEVWYDIVEYVQPMERRKKLLPPESKLNAIRWRE
ncbi:MAG: DUF4288 domain-containing protein [Verrucomicrobiota bacterium]